MKTLPIDIKSFSFVERERANGIKVIYRCGRDFMYFVLHYYFPDKFNKVTCGPPDLENKRMLGLKLPWFLMWTFLNFYKLPSFLSKHNLQLEINNQPVNSFGKLIKAILFSRISFEKAMVQIQESVNKGNAVGMDISLALFGLLDHVMFVYGYDDENLYIFDTHTVPHLEYEKIHTEFFLMRLPKNIIQKRWTKLSRIWMVRHVQ